MFPCALVFKGDPAVVCETGVGNTERGGRPPRLGFMMAFSISYFINIIMLIY
jgi:hypothetical protein